MHAGRYRKTQYQVCKCTFCCWCDLNVINACAQTSSDAKALFEVLSLVSSDLLESDGFLGTDLLDSQTLTLLFPSEEKT